MEGPLFFATEKFDPSDGAKWQSYVNWCAIPGLKEIVGLDCLLSPSLKEELEDKDWNHIGRELFCRAHFVDPDYLILRTQACLRRNILAAYRNPEVKPSLDPSFGDFRFVGYDLVEDATGISALTNCQGFPDTFRNDELNSAGLIEDFSRACEIRTTLPQHHPEEAHAHCELYALWRYHEAASVQTE